MPLCLLPVCARSYPCTGLGLGLPCDCGDQQVDETYKHLSWLLVFSVPLARSFLSLPSPFQASFWLQGAEVSAGLHPRNPEIHSGLLHAQMPGLSLCGGPSHAEHTQIPHSPALLHADLLPSSRPMDTPGSHPRGGVKGGYCLLDHIRFFEKFILFRKTNTVFLKQYKRVNREN